jgi:hypothetical protein
MDDMKLIGRSKEELINEVGIVRAIINDSDMKCGLEECAIIFFKLAKFIQNNATERKLKN